MRLRELFVELQTETFASEMTSHVQRQEDRFTEPSCRSQIRMVFGRRHPKDPEYTPNATNTHVRVLLVRNPAEGHSALGKEDAIRGEKTSICTGEEVCDQGSVDVGQASTACRVNNHEVQGSFSTRSLILAHCSVCELESRKDLAWNLLCQTRGLCPRRASQSWV